YVCTARNPHCSECFLSDLCAESLFSHNRID
ncbi:MAG: endonuclease III, partial [Treponema sp.]|nr:endonuclease III [Treponema sp.]